MERSDAKVAKGVFAPLADTWLKKGVEVTHALWRRLSVVVDAFADAGLLIEKVGEPHSTTRPGNRFLRRGTSSRAGRRLSPICPCLTHALPIHARPTHARWQAVDNRPTMGGCTYAPWP